MMAMPCKVPGTVVQVTLLNSLTFPCCPVLNGIPNRNTNDT